MRASPPLVLTVMLLVTSGCGGSTEVSDTGGTSVGGDTLSAGEVYASIQAATFETDGRTAHFSLDICERPLLRFDVEETPEAVKVGAVTTDDEDPAECAIETTVTLHEPLDERTLVELGSGETITPRMQGSTE